MLEIPKTTGENTVENIAPQIIRERLKNGWQLNPRMRGLQEEARDLVRPRVEAMRGREIIYCCRLAWLVRVEELEVNEEGFRALAVPIREVYESQSPMELRGPFRFGAIWRALHLCGRAVSMAMITDHFYPDAELVAEVKRALGRGASGKEITAMLRPPAAVS